MYRKGEVYNEIKSIIIDIYIDYNVRKFPVDEKKLCRKMGVALIPYSAFDKEGRKLLNKKSSKGFFVKESNSSPPTIYYNDRFESEGEIRFTIFHELKHFVFEDDDDSQDDLADFFARYIMCPVPYLLLKNIVTTEEVMSYCNTTFTTAEHAVSNIINRKNKYGYKVFDYEVRLIEHLDPILIEVYMNEKELV